MNVLHIVLIHVDYGTHFERKQIFMNVLHIYEALLVPL